MSPAHSRFCVILILGLSLVTLFSTSAQGQSYLQMSESYLPEVNNPDAVHVVAPKATTDHLRFWGNVLIDTPTLSGKTGLEAQTNPTKEALEAARQHIVDFYQERGFPLVQVEVRQKEKRWIFFINEGILRAVNVYGLGWWDTFTIRTNLLPYDTFQLNALETKLRDWMESHPDYQVRYELETRPGEETAYVDILEKRGPFVGDLRSLLQIQKHATHSLNIYFERGKEQQQVSFGLDYTSAMGLGLSGRLTKPSLLMSKDRFFGKAQAGITRRGSIDPAQSGEDTIFTNGELHLRWYTPPLSGEWLRLFLDSKNFTGSDQRPDLPIDHYRFFQTEVSLNIDTEFARYKSAYLRVGYDLRHAFNLDRVPTDPYNPSKESVNGFMFGLGLDMLLSKPRQNYRLNNYLRARYDFFLRDGTQEMHRETEIEFQQVFFRRMATYILNTRGIYLAGPTHFFDERPITSIGMRNSFNRLYFIRRGLNTTGEIRFNVWGNDLQLGIANDFSVFGFIDRTTNHESLEIANAVGPVFYTYFFNAFELSIGFSTGFTTALGPNAYEMNIGFNKVF